MNYAVDSVKVASAETFSNRLVFYNMSDKSIMLRKIRSTQGAVIGLPDSVLIEPGSKNSFFVQFLADPIYLRKIGTAIHSVYEYDNHQLADSFYLVTSDMNQLSISPFAKDVYLDANSEKAQLQMSIINNGYSPVTFTLEGKPFPEGITIYSKNQSFVLQAGEQRIVTLELKNHMNNYFSNDFKFYLSAINDKGERLAQTAFNLLNLSSEKRFAVGNNTYNAQMDFIRMGYFSTNAGASNLDVSAKVNHAINAGGNLSYQLNYRFYNQPIQGSEIFSSYVSYQDAGFGVRLGTIMENIDFSAYGQGAEVKVKLAKEQQLTSFYLQKNYLLYSNVFSGLKGADVWGLKYDYHEGEANASQVTFLKSNDPITNVNTRLVHGSRDIQLSNTTAISLEAGLSHETFNNHNNDFTKAGISIGVNYHTQIGDLAVSSNNYYSSPYYDGLHRGSVQLNERVSLDLGQNWNTYLQLDHQQNQPKYLNLYYNYWTQNNHQSIFGWSLGKSWNGYYFSLKPYFFQQHLTQTGSGKSQNASSNAWHIEAIGAFPLGKHLLNLRADYGLVQTDNPYYFQDQIKGYDKKKSYQDWRLSLSYNYLFAGIDFTFQHNPYYIFEEANAWQSGNYRQYSIGPHVNIQLFKKKVSFKASSYLNYNGYWDYWTNNYQLEANWSISRLWQIQAFSNILTFQRQVGSYQQARVSIMRKLLRKNSLGNHQWIVRFYGDINANGHWDKDETAIQGVIGSINGAPAISDKQGKMIFSNLEDKWYKLLVEFAKGWTTLDTIGQLVDRNIRQDIPLIKCSRVTGSISGKENPYTGDLPSLEGIRVHAISRTGNAYSSLTDSRGDFVLFLPYGKYDIFIERIRGNFDIIVGRTKMNLDADNADLPATIHFEIIDAKKRVEIQKF